MGGQELLRCRNLWMVSSAIKRIGLLFNELQTSGATFHMQIVPGLVKGSRHEVQNKECGLRSENASDLVPKTRLLLSGFKV